MHIKSFFFDLIIFLWISWWPKWQIFLVVKTVEFENIELFNLKTLTRKRIKIKRNKDKLIISINFSLNFKEGKYNGLFKFGGKYKNQIKISNENNVSIINRVFSPPDDENLNLDYISKKRKKNIKMKKDNCFRNFFIEILKVIKEKNYSFYYKRMEQDVIFRSNLI